MLTKLEQTRMVQNLENFGFMTKTEFLKIIFDEALTILQDVSVAEVILIFRLLSCNPCNQVKSCTKHGKPNQYEIFNQ